MMSQQGARRPMKRILIANRGEIALRVMRTAHAMGFETVAVYSEPDARAPHVHAATYAVALGGQSAAESYLDVEKILDACERSGADSVHPGYGFLSERSSFARALSERGITFIGPPVGAIEAMGSKSESKRLMLEAGVPCVPGYHGEDQTLSRFASEAGRIGYPVMVKASAGGGGKGMRLVYEPAKLEEALRAAASEARNAFGDETLLLEKAIVGPRHIEIQIFADTHGNVIHLGERDCSVQRRHQKVIEEAPGVGVSDVLRQKMGDAAVAAARSIDYVGAGTVEFLLLPDGETFYFLEINTRLQVEHPVTEMITGYDLVRWQLLVAQGDVLPQTQGDVRWRGHAVEVRLYAEDPYDGFLPQSGRLGTWQLPSSKNVRVDSGVRAGQEISPFYDPMLAKLIVWGETREEALRGLTRALEQSVVLGTRTNTGFLLDCLRHKDFVAGGVSTDFIREAFPELTCSALTIQQWAMSAAVWATLEADARSASWGAHQGWASSGERRDLMCLAEHDEVRDVEVVWGARGVCAVEVWGEDGEDVQSVLLELERCGEYRWRIICDGVMCEIAAVCGGAAELWCVQSGRVWRVSDRYKVVQRADEQSDGMVRAPMTGKVLSVRVEEGDAVVAGELLVVLEAMKMEHELVAPVAGVIAQVSVVEGEQVQGQTILCEIEVDA